MHQEHAAALHAERMKLSNEHYNCNIPECPRR